MKFERRFKVALTAAGSFVVRKLLGSVHNVLAEDTLEHIVHLPESIVFRPSSVNKLPYDVSSLRQHGLCHNMAPGKYIYNVTITTPCEFWIVQTSMHPLPIYLHIELACTTPFIKFPSDINKFSLWS